MDLKMKTVTLRVNAAGQCFNHVIPPQATIGPDIPCYIVLANSFNTGGGVRAMAVTSPPHFLLTGGRGCVKMWDITDISATRPGNQFACQNCIAPINCLKVTQNGQLIAGGQTKAIYMWDVNVPQSMKALPFTSPGCTGLAVSPDSKMFFSSHNDGTISAWDLHNQCVVRSFSGHSGGSTYMDISGDGSTLVTGGRDAYVRYWDLSQYKQGKRQLFVGSITALSSCRTKGWVAVGSHNDSLGIIHENCVDKYNFHRHTNSVTSLKFAHSGKWFVSGGKDRQVNGWSVPDGASLFQNKESSTVMSIEILSDDSAIVIGTGDYVKVYEIKFESGRLP